jgi:hypothetical protein
MSSGWMRRSGPRACALALLLLLAPAARAQTTDSAAPPEGPRLRFGVGLISGGTLVDELHFDRGIAALLGLDLRLGVQLNERFAVMYQGGATFYWPWIANAALVEVTPIEYVSLAVGGGIYWIPVVGSGGGGDKNSLSVGVPIRVALNVPVGTSSGGQRHAIAFSVMVVPAATLSGDLATGFQLGLFGGISYELY